MFATYSPSLVLTWTDRRPQPCWCLFCLLLLLAITELAARGYGEYALAALPAWALVARVGMPRPRDRWRLEIHAQQCWLSGPCCSRLAPVAFEPHAVLLPRVCVLVWLRLGSRRRHYLWLWAADFDDADYRALRRWWLVYRPREERFR